MALSHQHPQKRPRGRNHGTPSSKIDESSGSENGVPPGSCRAWKTGETTQNGLLIFRIQLLIYQRVSCSYIHGHLWILYIYYIYIICIYYMYILYVYIILYYIILYYIILYYIILYIYIIYTMICPIPGQSHSGTLLSADLRVSCWRGNAM